MIFPIPPPCLAPQCGQRFADLEIRSPHSLHLVSYLLISVSSFVCFIILQFDTRVQKCNRFIKKTSL